MNFQNIEIWPILTGLGLFLYGMFTMEEALKSLAGRTFKKFLRKHTNNGLKAALSGALVTGVLQSSSMVSLLVMSFAGAGIIGLKNGIGMIMGANLGTTLTGWLVSLIGFKLDIGAFILPFLAVGGLGIIFLKSEKLSSISKLLMGFSFMFLGLNYMKNGFVLFTEHIDFSFLDDKNPLFFLMFGILLSASIQSSSASMMIFLSSLAAGVITINQGFYLVIGGDLGTTITAIIGTLNGNTIRKKVGWSQFSFNMFNALFTLLLMKMYSYFILDFLNIKDELIALVVFHSFFNLMGIIILLPFLNQFTALINKIIRVNEISISKIIVYANADEPHAATDAFENECKLFLKDAINVNQLFFHNEKLTEKSPNSFYFRLKSYEAEIVNFYLQLQKNELSEEEVYKINNLVASIRNATLSAKDIKDVKHNLNELQNAATDKFYHFYKSIKDNQKVFYASLSEIITFSEVNPTQELEQLSILQESNYAEEIKDLYSIFSSEKEIEISSLLNMLREINSSNEALIRATKNLIKKVEVNQSSG